MNETITVDDAISKGHRMVTYPGMVLLFGSIGSGFYLGIAEDMPAWIFLVGFIAGFALAWFWWSMMITKWRLWAFEHVRNVHELKKRAIREKLIWDDNSFFEKTEIRSDADKRQLRILEFKFEQEDVFLDDPAVPDETVIYYAKAKNFVEMAIMLGCFGIGMYMLIKGDNPITGAILSIAGGFLAFKEYRQATNREPQIILNTEGIKTINTDFYKWSEVTNEDVIREGSGKNTYYCLTYDFPGGSEELKIDDYDTDEKSLNKLLILYRGRSRGNQ